MAVLARSAIIELVDGASDHARPNQSEGSTCADHHDRAGSISAFPDQPRPRMDVLIVGDTSAARPGWPSAIGLHGRSRGSGRRPDGAWFGPGLSVMRHLRLVEGPGDGAAGQWAGLPLKRRSWCWLFAHGRLGARGRCRGSTGGGALSSTSSGSEPAS